jgi:hypothetical protein
MLVPSHIEHHSALAELIAGLDQCDPTVSFGADIDTAQQKLLDPTLTADQRVDVFFEWAARSQPCLFGRLGAKGSKGVGIDVCWIIESDILAGDAHLTQKIQCARRAWKERAADGLVHGFLIMFNHQRLARARPSVQLLHVCQRVADLYVVEHAPINSDVIYAESIPLRTPAGLFAFEAGINIFYPSAHRTLNHDRRVPGGLMISVNSPGHYAHSLVTRGLCSSIEEAATRVKSLVFRSVGNGGIGNESTTSCSWHHEDPSNGAPSKRACPGPHSDGTYSALYHTDVLVPTMVTTDGTIDPDVSKAEIWSHLIIDYITTQEVPPNHLYHGLFHGRPIADEAMFHNPWPPRRALRDAIC